MATTVIQSIGVGGKITAEVIAGIAVTLSSAFVAYYAREIHRDWKGRGDRVDELYQAMFGMDNVNTIEGVIEIVESHDAELEGHHERITEIEEEIEKGKRKRQKIKQRIDNLKENSDNRQG